MSGNRAKTFRRWALKARYGITPEQWDAMYWVQKGACAVCKALEGAGDGRRLHVDHDHATGAVRGLLCGNCNQALGKLKHSLDLIEAAAHYLRTR